MVRQPLLPASHIPSCATIREEIFIVFQALDQLMARVDRRSTAASVAIVNIRSWWWEIATLSPAAWHPSVLPHAAGEPSSWDQCLASDSATPLLLHSKRASTLDTGLSLCISLHRLHRIALDRVCKVKFRPPHWSGPLIRHGRKAGAIPVSERWHEKATIPRFYSSRHAAFAREGNEQHDRRYGEKWRMKHNEQQPHHRIRTLSAVAFIVVVYYAHDSLCVTRIIASLVYRWFFANFLLPCATSSLISSDVLVVLRDLTWPTKVATQWPRTRNPTRQSHHLARLCCTDPL